MRKVKHVCPEGCSEGKFLTTAHVMQEWEVDAFGNFIKVVDDSLEVTHYPQEGNIWSCVRCNSTAMVVECND